MKSDDLVLATPAVAATEALTKHIVSDVEYGAVDSVNGDFKATANEVGAITSKQSCIWC